MSDYLIRGMAGGGELRCCAITSRELVETARLPGQFRCNCSRERVERALMLIDPKDLQELIDENRGRN